jgi:hypothetical protein
LLYSYLPYGHVTRTRLRAVALQRAGTDTLLLSLSLAPCRISLAVWDQRSLWRSIRIKRRISSTWPTSVSSRIMEPHGQSPCLHAEVPAFAEMFRAGVSARRRGTSVEIPSYGKASEGYPPVAKSTEASSFEHMNNIAIFYAFIHGQSPWSSA